MKVFVNVHGELAIGELAFVFSAEKYVWKLFNGSESFTTFVDPSKWGWQYIGELDG
jgi:hypothetical protein